MAHKYRAVGWNRQKRIYDLTLVGTLAACIVAFAGTSIATNPNITTETIVIRSTALCAILLLHVILCIGPLARLDNRFLPLLYNRRHLGVTMFLLALVHGVFVTIQFHALGNVNPLVSIFTAYKQDYFPFAYGISRDNLYQFPFEPFGFFALVIFFFMAATSHDFWLRNLGASIWKTLHMLVYVAYALLILHVVFGALVAEKSPVYPILLCGGVVIVVGLHVAAARREGRTDRRNWTDQLEDDGYVRACKVDDAADGYGKPVRIGKDRIAIFRDGNRVYALSNTCRHQGGPLGEGRILDGCVTCPWHGWQYKPDSGTSPPPFHEVVPTFRVRVHEGAVYVHPDPIPLETLNEGALVATENIDSEAGSKDFYIGYRKTAPKALARTVRRRTIALMGVLVAGFILVAASQQRFGPGVFEFGVQRSFEGVLYETPLPMLRVAVGDTAAANFVLVGAGKHGLPDFAKGHDGKKVRFQGSLIYRDNMTMVELNDPASFEVVGDPAPEEARQRTERLGEVHLTGELVDTKCFFGVMRPATGKVHRACAVVCLKGGVPPGLLLRDADGNGAVVMLAGPEGAALDYDPEWAALRISADGTLELHDGVPVLRTRALSRWTPERQGKE